MKKQLVMCLLGCLLSSIKAWAYDFELNGLYYTITDATAKTVEVSNVADYDNNGDFYSGSITIPRRISYNNVIYDVTKIGNDAFENCRDLTSVSIPESVTIIGSAAFHDCVALSSITIPNSVTTIGDYAFCGCWVLSDVIISNSVTDINRMAFAWCVNLSSVTIPNTLTSIGDAAFGYSDNLTSVTSELATPLPITEEVFTNRANATLFVPVGSKAAYEAADYWKEFKEIKEIIMFADANVKALCVANWDTDGDGELSVAEAAAVTSLGEVFMGANITSFDEFKYFTGITEIPDWHGFNDCTTLTSIVIPASVTSICGSAFANCVELRSLTVDPDNNVYDSRNNCNAVIETATNKLVVGCAVSQIPYGITTIGDAAFWGRWWMQKMIIPQTVTTIEGYAFAFCISLHSIYLPASVSAIGEGAFTECGALTSVTVERKIPVEIAENVFTNRANATLYVPAGYMAAYQVSDYWKEFKEMSEIEVIEFADANVKALCLANWDANNDGELSMAEAATVTDLGQVFRDNDEITTFNELQYFTGLTSIGYEAFRACDNLISVIIPNGVTSIEGLAFKDCPSLTTITIPNSVTNIGVLAISWCSLPSITIPNSVTTIGEYAFQGCEATSVTVGWETPVALTESSDFPEFINRDNATLFVPVGSKAAYEAADCWKEFKEIVEVISFADANVKEFCVARWDTNGDGELSEAEAAAVTDFGKYEGDISSFDEFKYFTGVTELGNWGAFFGCQNLSSIIIPSGVTKIEGLALGCCVSLRSISVDPDNNVYDSRDNCNGVIETATNKLVVGCETTQIPDGITSLGEYAFGGQWGMRKVTLPQTLTTIESKAFSSCIRLTSITLPASVSAIGDGVFEDCGSLTSVIVEREVPIEISEDVFPNRANASLFVPVGCKAAYEAADYWKEFKEIIESSTHLVLNGDLEGDDVSCFYVRENYVENQDILHATIVNGVGKDGSRGFVVQSVDNPEEAWTSQFFVRLTQELPVGTKYRFSFDYKANQDADTHMECHHEPSEFIYGWFGGTSFTTSWQHYESEGTITEEQSPYDNQMRTIAFDLSEINTATTYYFDNFVFEIVEEKVDNNRLYITETAVQHGSGNSIPVILENEDAYGGLEFDVVLPAGMSLSKAIKSDRLGDEFTLLTSNIGENTYKVLLYNMSHQSISGNNGALLNLVLNVGSVAKGDYEVVLRNIVASDADASSSVDLADSYSILHVGDAMKGDVTGDGRVNVTDIMAVANYILKIPMASFNEQAADVNGDGRINVTDIMGIANIILKVGNDSQAAPRRRPQLLDPQ